MMGSTMEFLPNHRVFQTTDFDEGVQFTSQVWERHKAVLTEGRYGLRWNQVELDNSTISYIKHDCCIAVKAQGPLSDHFRLIFHKRGSIGHTIHRRSLVSDERSAVVHAPGIDLELDIKPFELLLMSFDGDFVRTALAQRFRKLPPLESWVGALPRSSRLETLQSMAAWLTAELDRPGSPLARRGKPRLHAERMLLSLFVECLAEAAPEDTQPVQDIGESHVRRAEAWIDAHLTKAIGVEEIATAIDVSVRSLQSTFQRVRGHSPLDAVLRRRLDRARAALLRSEPGATVTVIAAEFGFYELGRFSMRYREHFGESPSQTLAHRS